MKHLENNAVIASRIVSQTLGAPSFALRADFDPLLFLRLSPLFPIPNP